LPEEAAVVKMGCKMMGNFGACVEERRGGAEVTEKAIIAVEA
jgi:hypothetical protein